MPGARRVRKGMVKTTAPNKELGRGGAGRDGNGVQTFDGRSNLQSGENNGQPVDPGPGAGQVKTDTA